MKIQRFFWLCLILLNIFISFFIIRFFFQSNTQNKGLDYNSIKCLNLHLRTAWCKEPQLFLKAMESPLLIHEKRGVILYEIRDSIDRFYCIATLPCWNPQKNVMLDVNGTMWLNSLYIISVYEGFNKLASINMTKSIGNHMSLTQGSTQAASVADKK